MNRTTVTFDDDVYGNIEDFMRGRGVSFKEAVNQLVRLGVLAASHVTSPKAPKLPAFEMGVREGVSVRNIGELEELLSEED
jgi:hypothetical protein